MPVTVITGKEMRRLESEAFAGGADPLIAMEHAAEGVARHLFLMVPSPRALVVCGQGNNGADGLAAARLIRAGGGDCEAVLLGEMKTDEGRRNLNFLRYLGIPVTDVFPEDPAALGFNCVVDALWGTGFSGAPRGKGGEWIGRINRSGLPVLSVDMPSGMDADTGMCCGDCVHADKTVTFHAPKAGLYFSPVSDFCGERVCWDIGFRHTESGMEALTEDDLDRLLPPRPSSLHKGRAGRVLVLAGSPGKAGAAAMCALGALRAGAGLVTVACPEEVMPVLQTLVPNAMCVPRDEVLSAAPAFDVRPYTEKLEIAGLTVTNMPVRHPVPCRALRLTDGNKTLVFTGDTNECPGLADFARDADALLADSAFLSSEWNEKMPHMSAKMCGELARDARVKHLYLTHLAPRHAPDAVVQDARAAFENADIVYPGMVISL